MNKFLFYHHATSYNHGCEAIVKSTKNMLLKYNEAYVYVSSEKAYEDREYFHDENIEFEDANRLFHINYEKIKKLNSIFCYVFKKIPFFKYQFKNTIESAKKSDVIMSIGGDNYSYGKSNYLSAADRELRKYCDKSVLWGCSIDGKYLEIPKYKNKVDNLKNFSMIIARESITYKNLLNLGLKNVKLYPDPAFTLNYNEDIKVDFDINNTIGINVSKLILDYDDENRHTLKAYKNLICYILENTNYQVVLIPHVVCDTTNDIEAQNQVLKYIPNSYKDRIFTIEKGNCEDLKGIISKCRFFIGGRTHATIAAYSTCVPTLVVGYSVKSKGIAKDLFGTYENYVISYKNIETEDEMIEGFKFLQKNEDSIRKHLEKIMPSYIEKAYEAGKEIYKLVESKI